MIFVELPARIVGDVGLLIQREYGATAGVVQFSAVQEGQGNEDEEVEVRILDQLTGAVLTRFWIDPQGEVHQ